MLTIIFKLVGYLGWLITTALGIGGSWFWNFTETDPDDSDRKRLTPAGRRAIFVMAMSVTCAVLSTSYNEIRSFYDAKAKAIEKRNLEDKFEGLEQQNVGLAQQNRELSVTVHQLLSRHGLLELSAGDRNLQDLFERFEPHVRGREEERQRLSKLNNKPIHFGSMGLLATFTLRDFGRQASDRLQQMACIISLMEADIVWLQELRDVDQLRVLRRMLPQYDVRWGNVGRRPSAPGTGLAMLYRRATVDVLDEPQFFPSWRQSEGSEEYTWYRVPFSQTVRVGDLKLQIVNLKLYWGSSSGPKLERRLKELDELTKWIDRRKSDDALIIAGQFNWDTDHDQMKRLAEMGFFIPTDLLPEEATESSYNETVRRYSHFVLSKEIEGRYINGSVRYQPLRPLFPDLTDKELMMVADHKPLLIAIHSE